jgi:hypothetical protein
LTRIFDALWRNRRTPSPAAPLHADCATAEEVRFIRAPKVAWTAFVLSARRGTLRLFPNGKNLRLLRVEPPLGGSGGGVPVCNVVAIGYTRKDG